MNMNPELLFDMVAKTVPQNLHRNILIVGSLAAAYHHRDRLTGQVVATKDADVIVQPAGAVSECAQIAKRLLEAGWQRTEQCYAQPAAEPQSTLRAIRLQPSNIDAFFVELLGLPQTGQKEMKRWVPCQLDDGWYGIPCFKFMVLLARDRRDTKVGIQHASPPLMALANLLSHPTLGTARMEGAIESRRILRSAKDLGRALALAWLRIAVPSVAWSLFPPMRIVCISDTHEQERSVEIPPCDLLIHAGDITFKGDLHKLGAFDDWCETLPLPKDRILVCAGNHDVSLEKTPEVAAHAFLNCTYVRDATVVVDGVRIYMSPWQPRFNDWAFNLDRGSAELAAKWNAIPDDTDILVTHGPPYGFGDLSVRGLQVGCELLLERIEQLRPRFHVCGHVHEGYGRYETDFGTVVVNASVCDARYRPVNAPIVIEW